MMMIQYLLLILILSAAVFVVPKRWKIAFSAGLISVAATLGLITALQVIISGNDLTQTVMGITATVDRLSAVFVIIISLVSTAGAVYATGYLKSYYDKRSDSQISIHGASLVALTISMMFVTMFRDAFGFLFFWELMTLASYLLVMFDSDRKEVAHTAMNYLIMMHIGFLFLFAGFIAIGDAGLDGNATIPVFLLFLVGFGMKAGIFPLHVWLPEAHPAAPSHVSAVMSAVMIKMGIYGMFRICQSMTGADNLYTVGIILLAIGVVSGLYGIRKAAVQTNLKRLLAYSSIENIGIIFVGIAMGCIGRATGNGILVLCGFGGALLHVVNHSFFKSLLFMGAGSVYTSTHSLDLDKLGGLGKKMPVTSILFLLGSLAICALPPFNGFFSEMVLYFGMFKSIADSQSIIWAICGIAALAVIGGFAIITFSKAYGMAFLGGSRCCSTEHAKEVSTSMLLAQVIPLAGIIIGGPAFYFVVFDSAATGMLTDIILNVAIVCGILVTIVVVLALIRRAVLRRRTVAVGPTWGCGFTRLTSKTQYTATSFADELTHISSTKSGSMFEEEEIFPSHKKFCDDENCPDKASKYITRQTFSLLRRMTARLAVFQSGRTNDYILHALLFIVAVILLTMTGIL